VNGNTLVVTIPSDDGSGSTPGTLSNALKQATTGQSITFALPGGVNTIQISGKLPSVPKGVNIQATCNAGKPGITLDGSGVPNVSEGLILGGSNNIYGLRVTKFKGTQIRALGNGNKISCVAAVR